MDLKIKDEQLVKLQALVNQVSQTQMELGQVESRKFDLIAAIPVFRKDLETFQKELEDEYGKVIISVSDGTIRQKEDGADKEN
ncbi:hypothetical protein N9988_00275 [bacterium]|nr:hypothetical protein [bacterium]